MNSVGSESGIDTVRIAIAIGIIAILVQLIPNWSTLKPYLDSNPLLLFSFSIVLLLVVFGFMPYLFLLALSYSPSFFGLSLTHLRETANYWYFVGCILTIVIMFTFFILLALEFVNRALSGLDLSVIVVLISLLANVILVLYIIFWKK